MYQSHSSLTTCDSFRNSHSYSFSLPFYLSVSVTLSLSLNRWNRGGHPYRHKKEANTCLVSDLESVPSVPDWVCCLLGVLSEAKRERSLEQRRRHHLRVCPKPSSFHGADTGPGWCMMRRGIQGCRNSPTVGILGLERPSFKPQSFLPESQLPPRCEVGLVIPALHVLLAVTRATS